MYCKKCGKDYPKNKKTCKDCGIALTPGKSPGNKKSSNLRMIIVGASVLVVILAVFLIIGLGGMLPEKLKGTWYDTSGITGTIEFAPSGAMNWRSFGKTSSGNYSYNGGTGEGSLKLSNEDKTHTFTCDGTTLTMDKMTYTKEYREQVDIKNGAK
jgi:predicted nucleic acid-binding Zn ribbon protein